MAYFNYLSEPIYCNLVVPDAYINTNVIYEITIYPRDNSDDGTVIYSGSVFYTGPTKVYLNDILETYMNNNEWFKNLPYSTEPLNSEDLKYFYADVIITTNKSTNTIKIPVVAMYRNPNSIREKRFESNDLIKSLYDYSNNVLPRLPHSTIKWDGKEEFVFATRIFKDKYITSLPLDYKTENETANIRTLTAANYMTGQINITSNDINTAYNNASDKSNIILTVVQKDIAIIDENPADYYLLWINRYGCTQCQPFCKKNTLSESVKTNYRSSIIEESIPYNKTIDFKWTLNSHWLTFDEHAEFESILTSKYVWLYDYKRGQFHPVNVTDSNWTYKNAKNTNKPFNLTINLTKAIPQNITY